MATDGEIRDAMMEVEDPELGINVVDLGLLYDVHQDEEGNVRLDMTLTSMGCPLTDKIIEERADMYGFLLKELGMTLPMD